MTIKEIEEASGMLRANIRYYESEGFLNPGREKNGYRNYSEEDLELLMKIKLLRSLHISLEEIKAMHQGEQELGKTLELHVAQLSKQQQELEKSKYVCEKMQKDGATYEKLNTEQYLLVLKNCHPEVTEREEWVERDVPEPVRAPFLRIFSRLFDYLFYAVLWVLLVLLWHKMIGLTKEEAVLGLLAALVAYFPLALLLEPLFIHFFGTTPGKLLLGLRVVYDLGGPIPMDMAWCRSWRAICGVHDWRYRDLFQAIRIYEAMDRGKPLDWDYEANTTIELKDEKRWRRIVLVAVVVVCILLIKGTWYAMGMLPNRGAVTAEEFAENYNTRLDYVYGGGTKLMETGEWVPEDSEGIRYGDNYVTVSAGGQSRKFQNSGTPKKVDIIEENGIVTEVGFFYETINKREYISNYKNLMLDLTLTFLEAEQKYSVFTYGKWAKLKEKAETLIQGENLSYLNFYQTESIKDFSYDIGGVKVSCDVELRGYELWQNRYVATEGADTYYSVRFSVKKSIDENGK